MLNLFIIIFVVGAIVVVVEVFFDKDGIVKKEYKYNRKNFFLSRAEHECYDALMAAVGQDYFIFAQVHLPTILDNKVVGQNWRGAFKHINEKSVDFVLCDKSYIAPKLVIELDDKSHERADRKIRDTEIERILKEAGIPLLRLENRGSFNANELASRIKGLLVPVIEEPKG